MPGRRSSAVHAARVGREIAQARRERELTQRELGQILDVDQSYVAAVETGRANPTLGQLAHIAAALDARLDVTFTAAPPRAAVVLPDAVDQLVTAERDR